MQLSAFNHEAENRLKKLAEGLVNQPAGYRQEYAYDQWGNWWVPEPGGNVGFPALSNLTPQNGNWYTNQNRLTGVSYDGAGNLQGLSPFWLEYDGEGRVKSATSQMNGWAVYGYDGGGRRIWKTAGSGTSAKTTFFVYDAFGGLAVEVGMDGGVAGVAYSTVDQLGSTRLVTDGSGEVVRRYDYYPFGQGLSGVNGRSAKYSVGAFPSGSDGQTVKFTGKERDAETGLDYFGFRYMSAAQGRFTSPDPAGASAILDDPQTWNRYSYVNNRPLAYIDPDGLIPVPVIAGGIGAGTAAIGSAASQYLSTRHVDWSKVGIAAGGGFVSGATFGPVGGLVSKIVASPWVTSATAGAVSNTLGGITARTGNALADDTALAEAFNPDALESDAAYGVVGGTLGETAGRFWRVLNAPYLPKRPSARAHSAQSQAAKAAYGQAARTLNEQSTGQGNSASTWFGAFFTNIFAPLRDTKPAPKSVITTKICYLDADGKQVCQ